jgi:hypothetical protein
MTLWQSSLQALALSMGGMTALALAMDRHYAQLKPLDEVPAAHRMALRVLGGAFAGSLAAAIRSWSATVGTALVLGFWSLGALATVAGAVLVGSNLAVAAAVMALLGAVSCLW